MHRDKAIVYETEGVLELESNSRPQCSEGERTAKNAPIHPEGPFAARLRHDVEEELGCEPSADAVAIAVAVEDAVVTLSGHIASHAEKIVAEHAAARVRGVKAIVGELEVKLPDSSQLTDEEAARTAIRTLSWNTPVPADRIKVWVEHGWKTLEGDSDWRDQKTAAYDAVCNLKGVRGIRGRVAIKPATISTAIKSTAIKAHVEAALRQKARRTKESYYGRNQR